jgi:hypothetical protein
VPINSTVGAAAVGQLAPLEAGPQLLDRVQLRRVRRQICKRQPRLSRHPVLQVTGVMGAEVVPDDRHRLVVEVVAQAVQHADELPGVVGAPSAGRTPSTPPARPRARQAGTPPGRTSRSACHAGRGGAAPACRPWVPRSAGPAESALLPIRRRSRARLCAFGCCTIRGHSSATHRAISCSLRSTALRAGRCRLHRICLGMRHTCPAWCPTPVTRSITSATRASVHWSLSNPAATAPRSSTRLILASSAGPSWAGLPRRAVRIPAVPPRSHRAYQRLAACADTPNS